MALLLTQLVLACPACGAPDDKNAAAYIGMTVMMSLLPLAAIGGMVWWVARNMRGE